MGKTITGKHTGDTYTKGELYQGKNGYTYLLNDNGTFTNINTGTILRGDYNGPGMGENRNVFIGYDERFRGDPTGVYTTDGSGIRRTPDGWDADGRPIYNGKPGVVPPVVTVGPGVDGVKGTGDDTKVTTGPGTPVVLTKPPVGDKTGGKPVVVTTGPGNPVVVTPKGRIGATLLPIGDYKPVIPIMADGTKLKHDQGWTNAAEAEDRWGEGELGSPTWFYQWGVAGADLAANVPEVAATINMTKKELGWLNDAAVWVQGTRAPPFVPERQRRTDYIYGEGNNPDNPMLGR